MKVLVTGGCGFIGSNFIRYLLQQPEPYEVVNLDALTYAGNPANLGDVQGHPGYTFIHGDVCDRALVEDIMRAGIEAVVHLAAESHVDRSILDASAFVRSNVLGTQTLLDAAHKVGLRRFLQVSSDEVYGSLGADGSFTEESPLAPNSPYAASKAGADLLVRAFFQTHGVPAIITRASNTYGPYQFPEKIIPLFLTNALDGRELPVYGDGQQVREWLFVEDHCAGLLRVLREGSIGEVYNIGGRQECTETRPGPTHPRRRWGLGDADPVCRGPTRSRPALCAEHRQDGCGTGVETQGDARRRAGAYGGLVPGPRILVAPPQEGTLCLRSSPIVSPEGDSVITSQNASPAA